jgi:hypothetical protein
MSDEDPKPKPGGKEDTSDYSASKAPETRREAEERETTPDDRLMPGGAQGSAADAGMSGMDRKDVPSGAAKPEELRAGDSPDGTL